MTATNGAAPVVNGRLLYDHHRRELHESGIDDETIQAAGIYTETNYGVLQAKVRWNRKWPPKMGPAIVYPYPDADGKPTGIEKLKPDGPRNDATGKPIKYEWPRGEPARIYYPPGIGDSLADDSRLVITEGEKKALAAMRHGFPTLGLPGVWGFTKKGSAELLPGFESINWKRDVVIAFDSDGDANPKVRQAESRLAATLKRRGARVKVARIPEDESGKKTGVDDFIVAYGPNAFAKLLDHAEDPDDEPAAVARESASNLDAMPEARRLLAANGRDKSGVLTIRYHRENWYRHTGRRYVERSGDDVRAAVTTWLDKNYFNLTTAAVGHLVACLKAECHVASEIDVPAWLGTGDRRPPLVAVHNGLLDVEAAVAGKADPLRPHSPEWLSTVCLPYEFDPSADCPRWRAMLDRNLAGDAERIMLLDEFIGYCLTRSTDLQKFLILLGEGATGKSSVLAGLIALLGATNVSAVPLERFGDRFALFQTLGKLANVSAEIGETDKVAEGYLKALTSGDPFEFERKHRDPITAMPTARLIFSTNNFPRFADRTGGLWRRLILLPFTEVIPEADRIVGMDKPQWWQATGELPGMLNRALDGLRRLRTQGRFTESRVVAEAVAEHRRDSNPAQLFLLDRYREHEYGQESKADVFSRYLDWCGRTNHRPLTDGNFAKEVVRTFPMARQERPRVEGGRVCCWVGIARGADDE